MLNFMNIAIAAGIALMLVHHSVADDVIIDFESAEIGKPMVKWMDKEVVFELAHAPEKSKAIGRVMFFPHLGTQRKGILNAMANESIPVRITFPRPADKVQLVMWGSTTSAALVEAYDSAGKLIAKDGLDHVPVRKSPEEQVPFFELSVAGSQIAYLLISGSQPGGFLAIDELRCNYQD